MDPITIGLILGMATGVGKNLIVDKPRYDRQMKLASETQRYAPWTHLQAQMPEEPNLFGSMLGGAGSGASLGGGIQAAGQNQEMQKAMLANMESGSALNAAQAEALGKDFQNQQRRYTFGRRSGYADL